MILLQIGINLHILENRACVGIKVEPKDDEDWFCRACISRKQNEELEGKKKKRKKKDKEKREAH